jgi:thiol-disulfide isomerase/thioredoxin
MELVEFPRTRRFWTYPRSEWDPEWWHKAGVPYFGGDEWGRRTIVVGFWFVGYLVWAWRTCWCPECHEMREQTYRLLNEDPGGVFVKEKT